MSVNERQVALRSDTPATYALLKDYLDRRKVLPYPFNETAVLTGLSSDSVKAITAAMITGTPTPTTLAVDKATVENNGLFAALMSSGVIETWEDTAESDDYGNILNMVSLRDEATHDPIVDPATDREVYGLIQCISGTSDGDAIGTVTTQISFFIVAADGTITQVSISGDVEFTYNIVRLARHVATIALEGGKETQDIFNVAEKTRRGFEVQTAYAALEDILITTGAGGGTGTSNTDGKTLNSLPTDFNTNDLWQVRLNGVVQRKGTPGATIEVSYVDATHIEFRDILDPGDYFEIEELHN